MDASELVLSHDERCIVANAICWVLECPFESTFPPLLGASERTDLERLLEGLNPQRHRYGPITISFGGRYTVRAGRIRMPRRMARLMERAVGSYYGEMLHNRREFEIVTSLPWSTAEPVMSRLKTAVRLLPVPSYDALKALDKRRPYRNTSRDHADLRDGPYDKKPRFSEKPGF